MQIGIDSFAAAISDPATGLTLSPVERMHHLLRPVMFANAEDVEADAIGKLNLFE